MSTILPESCGNKGAAVHPLPLLCSAIVNEPVEGDFGSVFQPLFRSGSGRGSASSKADVDPAEHLEKELEKIRIEKHRIGMEEGRMEAMRAAQSAMMPQLRDFFTICDSAALFQQEVGTAAAHHMVDLALDIVHRVLSVPPSPASEKVTQLRESIDHAIAEVYGLKIEIQPDRLSALRDLCAALKETWPAHETTRIEAHESASGEAIRFEIDATLHSALEKKILRSLNPPPIE